MEASLLNSKKLKTSTVLIDSQNLDSKGFYGKIQNISFNSDLLWADPTDDKDANRVVFVDNRDRDCSVKFGLKPAKSLLQKNHYLSVIRAHQVQPDGYKMHKWGGAQAFPSVITIFSAPNYCGTYKNKGAVIVIEVISYLVTGRMRK